MIISNPTRYTQLRDSNLQVLDSQARAFLSFDRLRNASLDNHISNTKFMVQRPDHYKQVLDGITPLPPRSRWQYLDNEFIPIKRTRNISDTNQEKIDSNIQTLVNLLSRFTIAIESSGGLDCSLVIGALKNFQLETILVGVVSERYEFRTERIVQEILAKTANKWIPIQEIDTLPFSDLQNTPVHFLPNKTSLFYKFPLETMRLCKKNKVQLLINGMGFDTILIDAIEDSSSIPISWQPWSHEDSWFNEYIYQPNGIEYRSASSIWRVVETIAHLRQHQAEDTQKKWARSFFSNWIPPELSLHTYKADGLGVYISGIEANEESIMEVCRFSYSVQKDLRISPEKIFDLMTRKAQLDDKNQLEFMARVSFAVWINSALSSH